MEDVCKAEKELTESNGKDYRMKIRRVQINYEGQMKQKVWTRWGGINDISPVYSPIPVFRAENIY